MFDHEEDREQQGEESSDNITGFLKGFFSSVLFNGVMFLIILGAMSLTKGALVVLVLIISAFAANIVILYNLDKTKLRFAIGWRVVLLLVTLPLLGLGFFCLLHL